MDNDALDIGDFEFVYDEDGLSISAECRYLDAGAVYEKLSIEQTKQLRDFLNEIIKKSNT